MRLITRPDLDGITCGVLLEQVEEIEEVVFKEPRMFHSGEVKVTGNDIIANLPRHPDCHLWFDHHATNDPKGKEYRGLFRLAPSAARVIYEYYQNPVLDRYQELLQVTDRVDSGSLELDEIIRPEGYIMISQSISTDSETPSEIRYNLNLIRWLGRYPLERIMQLSEIRRRFAKLDRLRVRYRAEVRSHSRLEGRVIIIDLRKARSFYKRDRFYVYSLFPEANLSITIYSDEYDASRTAISVGHSIFRRTSNVHVGHLMARYGGGGHRSAGTCTVPNAEFDLKIQEITRFCVENT